MLELPEIQTLSRQINTVLSGKIITQVFNATKPHKFTFYTGDPFLYGKLLSNKTILSSCGYGMFVDINFSDDITMNLSDGVIIRYYNPNDAIPSNYQLLLTFNDGSFLVFSVAMYGFIGINMNRENPNKYYALSKESVSPLSTAYTFLHFQRLLTEAKKTLTAKALLATEQRIPGVGNGVIQDILFNASVHPKQKVFLLSDRQLEHLFQSLKETLYAMTIRGGRDTQADLYGVSGRYPTVLSSRTWKRPCPRCGGVIVKDTYLGGSVYYCPTCQHIR